MGEQMSQKPEKAGRGVLLDIYNKIVFSELIEIEKPECHDENLKWRYILKQQSDISLKDKNTFMGASKHKYKRKDMVNIFSLLSNM